GRRVVDELADPGRGRADRRGIKDRARRYRGKADEGGPKAVRRTPKDAPRDRAGDPGGTLARGDRRRVPGVPGEGHSLRAGGSRRLRLDGQVPSDRGDRRPAI